MGEQLPSREPLTELAESGSVAISGKLTEAALILQSWYKSKDSDSVHQQAKRKADYALACGYLAKLTYDAEKLGRQIQLTVGEKKLKRVDLWVNAYDFIEVRPGPNLEPGETMSLRPPTGLSSDLYLSDFRHELPVSSIAQTLVDGGKLELI